MNSFDSYVLESFTDYVAEEGAQTQSIQIVNSEKMQRAIGLARVARRALEASNKKKAMSSGNEAKKLLKELRKELNDVKNDFVSWFLSGSNLIGGQTMYNGLKDILIKNEDLFPKTKKAALKNPSLAIYFNAISGGTAGNMAMLAADVKRYHDLKKNDPPQIGSFLNRTRQICMMMCDELIEYVDHTLDEAKYM